MNRKENQEHDNLFNKLIKFEDEFYKNENSQLADIDVSHLFNLYEEDVNFKDFSTQNMKVEQHVHDYVNIKKPDFFKMKIEENQCLIKNDIELKNQDNFYTSLNSQENNLNDEFKISHNEFDLVNLKTFENTGNIISNPFVTTLKNDNPEKLNLVPENYYILSQNLKDEKCDYFKKFAKSIKFQKYLTVKYLDSFKLNFISYIDNQKKLLLMDLVEIEEIVNNQSQTNDIYKELDNRLQKFKANLNRICEDLNKLK